MDLQHYKADGTLKDGRIVHVRAIRPDDKAALLAGFQRLSGKSAYMRFMSPKNEITAQELAYYTEIDYVGHVALVATLEENEGERLIGSGRYIAYDEPGPPHRAELAFAVEDEFQGLGVATLVLRHLIKIARQAGIRELRADVLPQNTAMLGFSKKAACHYNAWLNQEPPTFPSRFQMNKALKTSVRPVSARDHGIVAATALQTRMKRLFTEGFTAIDIAQPLLSFDVEKNAGDVRRIMGENNILIAGARLNGVIAGYLLREALSGSDCASHLHSFDDSQTVNETAPFADVINALVDHEYCFISLLGTVGAVITRDDLQKPPVRMWLFGMITIIEMFLGRTIEILYPNEAWRQELSPGRLKKALQVLEERKRRNQSPRLLDCLQLSDKTQILIKDPVMREDAGFTSKREGERVIRELESLRNSLAHAQDIVTHDWNAVVTIANRLEKIMTRI